MRSTFSAPAVAFTFLLPIGLLPQTPSLTIQADQPVAKVSPVLYGLMTEEINFSYDGGLYAEQVRDRTIGRGWGAMPHWTLVTRATPWPAWRWTTKPAPAPRCPAA